MITVAMTPEQFTAKSAQLKAEQGLELTGDSGTLSKDGVIVDYAYDGENLSLNVLHKPFLVSESYVETKLRYWIGATA